MLNNISDSSKLIMARIGKAIEKGAGDDIRTYLEENNTTTNNALGFLRGDYINTNLKNMLESDSVEVKTFKRCSWTGCIIIDRDNKQSYSVCTTKTLVRISKNHTRRSPHYLQTMLNVVNREERSHMRQTRLFDFGLPIPEQFTEDEYEKDFRTIMENTLPLSSDFRHWVIAYDVDHGVIVNLTALLLDKDFNPVEEISLIDALGVDFSNLTANDNNQTVKKDARSLVSIKQGIKSSVDSEKERHPELAPKRTDISKES